MDERAIELLRSGQPVPAAQRSMVDAALGESAVGATPLEDSRALTILTTEHWSLLSARALVYNEAFTRVSMFLTFLSATLVALGLVSTATGFDRTFLVIAALTFAVDLFLGLVTLGRLLDTAREDLRYLAGMNRLRYAYHEIVPGLERYFMSGKYDDAPGILAAYGSPDGDDDLGAGSLLLEGLKTMPALVSVLCALLFGILVGIIALFIADSALVAAIAAFVGLGIGVFVGTRFMISAVQKTLASLRPEFPTPATPGDEA